MSYTRLILPLLVALVYLAMDILIYRRLRLWYGKGPHWKWIKPLFWCSFLIVMAGLFQALYRSSTLSAYPSWFSNFFVGFSFSVMTGKLLYGVILLIDWVLGLPIWGVKKVMGKETSYSRSRRKFVQSSSVIMAGIPFLSMIQGITFGKYDFQVRKLVLKFPDLPEAFHGFKIAQISDIHSGSFDSKREVRRGVDLLNDQKADLVVFTGDLVNSQSAEIVPFVDVFNKIKAPHGVMSTKGNHDYGLYHSWASAEEHQRDQLEMDLNHKSLGFDLLKNENRILEKQGQKICIAGVENWGKSPFPQIGDLDKAFSESEDAPFTVLLSHDPSHWDERVLDHPRKVHLTLAGHTHGMQFGVEIPGFKWSPVKYRYPRWAGLYSEKEQHLYVNRGFGFIGFPGRVGIRPEITVFELQKA